MNAETRREAARWLRCIDADLTAVRLSLSMDPPVGPVAGCHCQQAAEKIMKGLLVLDDEPFRCTHDLDELADGVLPVRPELRDTPAPLRRLTAWG
jgi:HEPN domain-containing protein